MDPDDPAHLVDRERALVGAALLDPVAADLLLAEVDRRDVLCPIAAEVLAALADLDPSRNATEPTLELVVEVLELVGVLEDLGGREAIDALVVDRPALREALSSLRAAVGSITDVREEPVVLLAAEELGADQADSDQRDPLVTASRDSLPSRTVVPSRDLLPSRASRHQPPSTRSTP